jgi:hypothetical protein
VEADSADVIGSPGTRLREELKRVTGTVQPGQLRPLLAPGPRRGRRPWLLPVAAGAGVIAVATAVSITAAADQRTFVAAGW